MCEKKPPEPKYRQKKYRKLILHEEFMLYDRKKVSVAEAIEMAKDCWKNLVSMEEAQQKMKTQKRAHQPKINHDIIIKSHSVQGSFVLIVIDEDVQCL